MSKLTNKRVLITGGSSGIGQQIALTFAQEGAKVVFSYHDNKKGAEQTLSAIKASGGESHMVKADMGNVEDLQALIEKTVGILGGIDILVNNAGTITRYPSFLNIPLDAFDLVQNVNVRAPFILMQLTGELMRMQQVRGNIINISSRSSTIITPGLSHYECSKAGLDALTRAAASALAPHGIRVNAIAPGLVATDINREQREASPDTWKERSSHIPLGRVGEPKDIAAAALFLASDESAWITGDIIPVDGGIGVLGL